MKLLGVARQLWEDPRRNPNALAYVLLAAVLVLLPALLQVGTGEQAGFLIGVAGDAGVFVLLAIGLNVVVGFAGLLDLGYAAFFAIGAYSFAMLASEHGVVTPLHQAIHLPFWVILIVGMFIAASFGLILGAPTLRLRGDYLAIVTLGFGEIVPRVFRNLSAWTSGVNGISALDPPELPIWLNGPWSGDRFEVVRSFKIIDPVAYYVVMAVLLLVSVVLVNNLHHSRLGRAWMAVREDEVAAAATGVNTTQIKLLAFSIGAAFSGFAGTYYGAKLSLVSPENFGFVVSITILVMVVLGGMGNIPGVVVGALLIYGVIFLGLPAAQAQIAALTSSSSAPDFKFLIFGLILVLVMLLRPQGLVPSRERAQELARGATEESVFEVTEVKSQA